MANWRSMILTYKGIALQTKVEAGKTNMHFTKMKSGVGSIDTSKELAAYTELAGVKQELEITSVEVQTSEASGLANVCKVTSTLYNNTLETGEDYYLRELGLYAEDPDEGEILYAVTVDDAPDFIPSALSGATTIAQEFNVYVAVGSSLEVTFDGATGGLASTGFVRGFVVTIAPDGSDVSYGHKIELEDNNNGTMFYKHQNGLYSEVNLSTVVQQVSGATASVNGITPNENQEVIIDTINNSKKLVNETKTPISVGTAKKPVYFEQGVPIPVGDSLDVSISGTSESSKSLKDVVNIGDEDTHIYFKQGKVTTPSKTIGGTTQFVYQASGKVTASTANVGNSNTPIYMDRGILKPLPKSLIDLLYPVGSIYISMKNLNPATLFGGTWEQLKDRFLLAAGDNYSGVNNPKGGESSHVLTVAEMPSHQHGGSTAADGSHSHTRGTMEISGTFAADDSARAGHHGEYPTGAFYDAGRVDLDLDSGGGSGTRVGFLASRSWTGNTSVAPNHQHTINSEGGNKAHNNMPPYITVYMWYRVS